MPGPLKPLIAIPTTAGTGSETTGVAIFDLLELHAKTGIAHLMLRPALGIVDPNNTRTLPRMVAACTGWDVLCHALESLTALPFNQRPAPDNPGLRPAYQGANPISDVWAARAIEMVSANLVRALEDPDDDEARSQMLLAATFAGIGFGNAGVHLPHGMSYPVSGMVRGYVAAGYPADQPLVPHGMAVMLNAPAVFRFTAPADPARHLLRRTADGRGYVGRTAGGCRRDSGLHDRGLDAPHGHAQWPGRGGLYRDDVDMLVAGTLPQHRVTKLSPRPAGPDDLRQLFLDSMKLW